jgi:AcrR family transcriptional regulator
MTQRINRRDLIIHSATDLFVHKGYAATSVRQIADAVGCTEAALYYHFKDGKRALLQAVIESKAPDLRDVLASCRQAESLPEFILSYVHSLCMYCEERERHMQWFVSEYQNLSDSEKSLFDEKHLLFHAELVKLLQRFVEDEDEANELGWMLICASFGYRQIFVTLGLDKLADFSVDRFAEKMACHLAQ